MENNNQKETNIPKEDNKQSRKTSPVKTTQVTDTEMTDASPSTKDWPLRDQTNKSSTNPQPPGSSPDPYTNNSSESFGSWDELGKNMISDLEKSLACDGPEGTLARILLGARALKQDWEMNDFEKERYKKMMEGRGEIKNEEDWEKFAREQIERSERRRKVSEDVGEREEGAERKKFTKVKGADEKLGESSEATKKN
jgi:hypothetical protein